MPVFRSSPTSSEEGASRPAGLVQRLTLASPADSVTRARRIAMMVAATAAVWLGSTGLAQAQLEPTRADPASLEVSTIADELASPWGLAFLPDGAMLVTEKAGQLRRITSKGEVGQPIAGVPKVAARGQGGLLDVVLSPGFNNDRRVYLSFAEAGNDAAGTAVGYGRLSADNSRLEDFKVIFRQTPKLSSGNHFGSRLVFDRAGFLYISLGENNERPTAQDLDKHQGKVVRVTAEGETPKDNPFVGRANALPEIWTYGQRNPQGMALHPVTGEVWTSEHGPRGGDEVNVAERGKNYGWPRATHGVNYSGLPIPEREGDSVSGTESPLYVWEKSPAISGMAFYKGDRYPVWNNALFVGALGSKDVIRLTLDGRRVVAEERLLGDLDHRIRDVRIGPDQALYVLTDGRRGQLLRVTPR